MSDTKLEEAKKMNVLMGDTVLVELSDGTEFEGTFDVHPLADICVRNQHGFPMNYKRLIKKL